MPNDPSNSRLGSCLPTYARVRPSPMPFRLSIGDVLTFKRHQCRDGRRRTRTSIGSIFPSGAYHGLSARQELRHGDAAARRHCVYRHARRARWTGSITRRLGETLQRWITFCQEGGIRTMQHQRPMSFVPIEKGATSHATIKRMGVQEKGEGGAAEREYILIERQTRSSKNGGWRCFFSYSCL